MPRGVDPDHTARSRPAGAPLNGSKVAPDGAQHGHLGQGGGTSVSAPAFPAGPPPRAGTALWWQQRYQQEARRRPRNDGLTIDRITAAALGIIDARGLDALTMRGLAAEVGSAAASLYRHVATREELLVLVMDRVLGEIRTPPPMEGWRPPAEFMARDFYRVLNAHPEVVRLLPGEHLIGPNALRGREVSLTRLMQAGFTAELSITIYANVVAFVLGHVLVARFIAEDGDAPRRTMYQMLDADEFPTVTETATLEPESGGPGLFENGLATLLDGFESRVGRS